MGFNARRDFESGLFYAISNKDNTYSISRVTLQGTMTQQECIFCAIAAGHAAAEILYQDDEITAFRDIQPVAPTHVLIIPNQHIESIRTATAGDELLIGRMHAIARRLAEDEGIDQSGYRLIINNGSDAGQVVHHLHLHLIGGQPMRYPMG